MLPLILKINISNLIELSREGALWRERDAIIPREKQTKVKIPRSR